MPLDLGEEVDNCPIASVALSKPALPASIELYSRSICFLSCITRRRYVDGLSAVLKNMHRQVSIRLSHNAGRIHRSRPMFGKLEICHAECA